MYSRPSVIYVSYFFFEGYAVLRKYRVFYEIDERPNVRRGRPADIENKIGVFLGNDRSAHLQAFQPRALYELSRGYVGRIFEYAAHASAVGKFLRADIYFARSFDTLSLSVSERQKDAPKITPPSFMNVLCL